MITTLNRFGGRVSDPLQKRPSPTTERAYTAVGRRCCRCHQSKSITGGRSRWILRSGQRVNEFTCAGCVQ